MHEGPESRYEARLLLDVPIFSGFSQIELIRQAKADLCTRKQQLRIQELQAYTEVISAYYNVKTAGSLLISSEEYYQYAKEAYDATLVGYRNGVQSFVDLETALATLANARGQRVVAKTGWFSSLAQLGYSMGVLKIP